MMNALKITIFTLIIMTAGLATSNESEALLPTHQCAFCHSLHGSTSTSSFVPQDSPTNIEVLCLGCHLTANGATAAVQPHRTGGSYAEFYLTCHDCHNIHDNMPNWRQGHSDAPDNDGSPPPTGWVEGTNAKMIGREDPDGATPYAMIQTREADFDKNGVPDRNDGATTQSCNPTVLNDCYVQGKRHVIFENIDGSASGASIHGFADNNEDGVDDTTAIGVATDAGGVPVSYSEYDSICQMCHSQTNNHNLSTGSGVTHNSGRRCTDCHEHGFCFDRGNSCSKWTVPNRDLQVDLVSAAPASVNNGDTVTVTVDVTNLGDNVEDIEVRYSSNIDGVLGRSTAASVASSGSGQTSLDWVTSTAGTHTVTAKIVPVIGELVIANNSGTDTVTITALDNHDVAVTQVTAPGPILQGNTETVVVDIANPGTFTETFNVVLYDNTDDPGHASPIGTLSSGALAPSGTTTLNFSWNTTGVSLVTHTLEAIATHDGGDGGTDTNVGNDSATTTATIANHDVAVTTVTAPPSVDQGQTVNVDVDIANLSPIGGFSETFNVTLYDDTQSTTIGTQSSGALAGGDTNTLTFSWNTAGYSIATHTLRAVADTVAGETITANNTATTTSDVIVPVTHDVAVESVTAPATVTQGATAAVDVVVSNNGGATEAFNVTLSSDLDGTFQTLSSGPLLAGNSTTLNFSWVTGAGTTAGLHTLTAVAATVPSEVNTADNTGSTTSTVQVHDVAVNSVTAPASTTQGNTAAVDVSITNQGDFTETFDVTLVSDLDGTIQTLNSGALGAGASTVLNFSWNTSGSTVGTHTLTATAATVTGEFDTADNSASTTADVAAAGPINDLAVTSVTFSLTSPINTCGSRSTISVVVRITNEGTVTESNFFVQLTSDGPDVGNFPDQQVTSLAAGTFTDLTFNWNHGRNDGCGTINFTSTVDIVSGETDTADNSLTEPVTIQ